VAVETVHGPGSVAVTGYAPDELARDPGLWLRSIHSQDRPAALEHFRRILSGHKREPLECRIIRKDGREIWVRSTPVLHFDDAGSLIAYDALIQDITEATLAREALRESEEKYRVLVENLHEVIFSVDANGFISYVSPIVEDLTGFGPEEITGEHFARFVHPHDRPLVEQQWQRTMQGQVGEYEFRVLTKWGDTRTVRMSSRQRMEAGEPSGLVGILSDRTERKKAEGELRHTEKCLRDILQKLHIPAVRIDGIGAIEYCNDAFLRLTARGRSTVIGKNWFDEFVSPHRRDSARAEYQGSLTAEPFPAEYTLELCGESAMGREARMRTTVTRDHDGNPTGVIGLGEGEV
jgi:PAS domain S-box-containing protein